MFNVICLETGEAERNEDGTPMVFANGQEAAAHARTATEVNGKKFQPRPIKDATWKDREAKRLGDGTYTRVPWDNGRLGDDWQRSGWWNTYRDESAASHFAHVSEKSPGCIAYTENEAKGAADIQAVMRPGRYLAQFYPRLESGDVRRAANEFLAQYGKLKLQFADTADDIEKVYVKGPRSCMSASRDEYNSPCHPCRIYAAGDLAVAYLVSEDDADHITARALCWPTKKSYGRIYGDDKLSAILQAEGYKYSATFAEGARMLKMQEDDAYVVPYVDGIYAATDAGKFLQISESGEINCESTDGMSRARWICDSCGEAADEEESSYIDSRDERWCYHCTQNDAFYCDDSGEMVANSDGVEMADGEMWSQHHFDRHGATCEATGRNYHVDDIIVLENGTAWARDYFEDHGRQCYHCGACMENDETCADCETDSEEEATPRPRVARQGRDESPAQVELPLTPADAVAA